MPEGTVELSSTRFMSQSSGRRSFFCDRQFPVRGTRHFQVLSMQEGLLLLELDFVKKPRAGGSKDVIGWILALLGGYQAGGAMGGMMASDSQFNDALMNSHSPFEDFESGETYELAKDEEIWAVARKKSGSKLIHYDEVEGVTIDPPGHLSNLAATVRIKAAGIGKIKLELSEQPDVHSAIELLEHKLSSVTSVNVELDPRTMHYVRKA